jgi:DNA-binding response OmpR family regulator
LAQVGILIVDDDVTSQRALKSILDSEGWRVRIVAEASHAMAELASGNWSLAIVNVALLDLQGPLFAILRDLAQAEPAPGADAAPAKMIRVLFLMPLPVDKNVQAVLERDELPYALKPCHLHDFLEKVSELLVEGGAIAQPLRTIGGFERKKRPRDARFSRDAGRGTMFASREDYQMTEEELSEFERQEETDRKKREKKHNGNGSF